MIGETRGGSKQDLKKEAQRTNRFKTNYSHNSTSPCLTPCNHLESGNGVTDDYKQQEKTDVPCINIILKPISDPKTDQTDKGIQIVEITATTENNNEHSINNANTSFPDEYQSLSKEAEKIEKKSSKVQTEVQRSIHDSSTQTTIDHKNVSVSVTEQSTPGVNLGTFTVCHPALDADINKRNRGVQFRDDKVFRDSVGCSNRTLSTAVDSSIKSLPIDNSSYNRDAKSIINIDDSTKRGIADSHVKTKEQIDGSDSMETLYKLINNKDKLSSGSELKSCVKKGGQEMEGKLSDRIKRNIDKLEVGSWISTQSSATNTSDGTHRESQETQTRVSSCNDSCKDIVSKQALSKTFPERSSNSLGTQNTSTLSSILSNNPPISRITINTTDTREWDSSAKNESSKLTIGTTVSDSYFSPSLDTLTCCSSRKFSIEGTSCKTRNTTLNKNDSENLSCKKHYPDDGRITACGTAEKETDMTEKNFNQLYSSTGRRDFFDTETTSLSKLGIDRNSSIRTKSTNTLNKVNSLESMDSLPLISHNKSVKEDLVTPIECCESKGVQTNSVSFSQTPEYSVNANKEFGVKPDIVLSRPNTRNFLTASDLTRPEFIRMLTEIKEHTCSLELQLSAMNEAMKRKQATRSKVLSSIPKDYESIGQDDLAYITQPKKIKTINESFCCVSSPIEYARGGTPEALNIENSINTFRRGSPDRSSLLESRRPENETLHDEICCGGKPNESYATQKSPSNLRTNSDSIRTTEPEEVIVPKVSNISMTKHKRKKPAFKTKRSYLWTPLHDSDYRIWKHKMNRLSPSVKSMIVPKIFSRSRSPSSFIVGSKVNVSCSPTNCCDITEDSSREMFHAGNLSPIKKLEESNVSVRSANNHSKTSNSSFNQSFVRPAFLSSTLKKTVKASPNAKYKVVKRTKRNSDHEIPQSSQMELKSLENKAISATMMSCCDLDVSEYHDGEKSSHNTEMESTLGMVEHNRENDFSVSPFQLKRPKVIPRLGVNQSLFKSRSKVRPKSIPSNSHLYSSVSRELFDESSSNTSSKNHKTIDAATRPFQLKKLEVVPKLKLIASASRNPSISYVKKNNSRAYLDTSCCGTSNENVEKISSHSKRHQSLPAEEMLTKLLDRKQGKDQFAYTIKTEQNTPFSANNFSKVDSEEEVNSTDYGFNKSGKETKDSVNGKKRKRSSGGKEFITIDENIDLSNFNNASQVRNWKSKNMNSSPRSLRYRERIRDDLNSKKNLQSVSSNQHSGKVPESNSNITQQKDSKCTIRVKVSLDDAPSEEEVEKVSKL